MTKIQVNSQKSKWLVSYDEPVVTVDFLPTSQGRRQEEGGFSGEPFSHHPFHFNNIHVPIFATLVCISLDPTKSLTSEPLTM